MTASLEILDKGFMTTIQDLGRFGSQALGMPVSGALDPFQLRMANALVGNPENTGALEIRLAGPTFKVNAHNVKIALTGTDSYIEILKPEKQIITANRSITLTQEQTFRIGPLTDSATCYLAVAGGFDVASVYHSQSTYVIGKIGGFEGRPLEVDDQLPLVFDKASDQGDNILTRPFNWGPSNTINVIFGPQADYFTKDALSRFTTTRYRVSSQSNRMGMRLEGETLAHKDSFNINSDGLVTGSIQVPGTGLPIILLADHQTTGGYPKLGTVISSDIPLLGRMLPGSEFRFQQVSVEEAENKRRALEKSFQDSLASILKLSENQYLLDYMLWNSNLISGVVYGNPNEDVLTFI